MGLLKTQTVDNIDMDSGSYINMDDSVNEFGVNEVNYSIADLTNNHSIMNINSSQIANIICDNNSSQNFTTPSLHSPFSDLHYDEELMNFLIEWNLESVYTTCIEKQIDVEALQFMQDHHFPMVLSNFSPGIQIKFEYRVKKYQQSLSINKEPPTLNNNLFTIQNITSQISQANNEISKNTVFKLNSVLTSNPNGSLILDYYTKHNVLNESCRNMLVEIIISDIIKNGSTMSVGLANSIANAIVGTFHSEIKDIYFVKNAMNSPKGKLYTKYFNTIRSMKQSGLLSKIPKEKSSKLICRTMDKNNRLLDKDLTWPEIEDIWRKTINFRLNFIKENNAVEIFNK
ncbi:hypothetical protein ACI65C_004414 [Semiaphis heraclei]